MYRPSVARQILIQILDLLLPTPTPHNCDLYHERIEELRTFVLFFFSNSFYLFRTKRFLLEDNVRLLPVKPQKNSFPLDG